MNGKTMGMAAIVAMAGMAFAAQGTQAQSRSTAASRVDVAKAERYEGAARATVSRQFFGEAARYFEQAADLRPAGDCQAVTDMVNAGRLRYYVGDKGKAQSLLEEAAAVAIEYGDVKTAATAFLDAAWIARERGQHAKVVRALLQRAHKLAQSPQLSADERSTLLARIDLKSM